MSTQLEDRMTPTATPRHGANGNANANANGHHAQVNEHHDEVEIVPVPPAPRAGFGKLLFAAVVIVAVFAFSRGWVKIGFTFLILFGVMLATTAIGPHLQNGVTTGIDSALNTAYAFFH